MWKQNSKHGCVSQLREQMMLTGRGGVEDTRLEDKAKDTKKNPRQRPRTQKNPRQRPRTGMLEAKAEDQGHKCKCFPKKKGLKNFFLVDPQKNGLETHFSADLQNFNHSKNSAVLEPRTGQFSRTRLRGQGLENVSSRPRTSSRTTPLLTG